MIDFIKILVISVPRKHFLDNNHLNFKGQYSKVTGEDLEQDTAEYKNLKVRLLRNNRIYIEGSLHKYWNYDEELRSGHNHDKFTFSLITLAIQKLCNELKLNPAECKIENLELGVNLFTDFNPSEIIKLLIVHSTKTFSYIENTIGERIGKCCQHRQYQLKIYDKGKQLGLKENILRIEVKIKKMAFLRSFLKKHDLPISEFKILTLADLLNRPTLNRLFEQISKMWKKTICQYDVKPRDFKNTNDYQRFLELINPNYWDQLKSIKEKKRSKREFSKLLKKYGVNNPINEILVLLVAELEYLNMIEMPKFILKIWFLFNRSISRLINVIIRKFQSYKIKQKAPT